MTSSSARLALIWSCMNSDLRWTDRRPRCALEVSSCVSSNSSRLLCNAIMDAPVTMKCDWKVLGHFPLGRDVCHISFFCPSRETQVPFQTGRRGGAKTHNDTKYYVRTDRPDSSRSPAGAGSTGPSKPPAGSAAASGSRRSAVAASAAVQVLRRMPVARARRAAKVRAERKRGAQPCVAQLASSSSR